MLTKAFLFSACALAVVSTVHADITEIDTFFNSTGTRNTYVVETGTQIGQAFTTGSTLLNLSNVVFPQVLNTPTSNADDFHSGETFGLYSSNPVNGTPILTTPLYTFSLTDNTVAGTGFDNPNLTFGVITATAPSGAANVSLASNTTYWLVLTYTSDVAWDYTNSSDYAHQPGITIPANASSFVTDSTGTSYSNLSDGPQLVTINAVPEPSSFYLLGLAGVGAFVIVRRVRSSQAA